VVEDPETGEKHIERVPKLLIPEVNFATLNLRDEATERQFVMSLKSAGVPVSDKMLAINLPLDAQQELEREAQETVDKAMAKAQTWGKVQKLCDLQGLPYPPELAAHLEATLQLRQMLQQTNQLDTQSQMLQIQKDQMTPAGQTGAIQPGQGPIPGVAPDQNAMAGASPEQQQAIAMGVQQAEQVDAQAQAEPPMASGPSSAPLTESGQVGGGGGEPPRNRSRPEISDEQRAGAPKAASKRWADRVHANHRFARGPSSVGHNRVVSEEQVTAAVRRREMFAKHSGTPLVSDLVNDPNFYRMLNAGGDEAAIRADWPEIQAGGAQDTARLLHDLASQYEEVTGVSPVWD
jgi:hypothetical protein